LTTDVSRGGSKLEPVTVRVNPALPAKAEDGSRPFFLIVGFVAAKTEWVVTPSKANTSDRWKILAQVFRFDIFVMVLSFLISDHLMKIIEKVSH
jgi:hypothetical protein